jgi:hypothetical protein
MVVGGCEWNFDLKRFFTEQRKFKPSRGKKHQGDVVGLDTMQNIFRDIKALSE